jgi:hypothetical protein
MCMHTNCCVRTQDGTQEQGVLDRGYPPNSRRHHDRRSPPRSGSGGTSPSRLPRQRSPALLAPSERLIFTPPKQSKAKCVC